MPATVSTGSFHHDCPEDVAIPFRYTMTSTTGAGTSLEWRALPLSPGPPQTLPENSWIQIGPIGTPLRLRFRAIGDHASYSIAPDANPVPPA